MREQASRKLDAVLIVSVMFYKRYTLKTSTPHILFALSNQTSAALILTFVTLTLLINQRHPRYYAS